MTVYLDYNATAPVRPEVRDLMLEIYAQPGNASSVHGPGRLARKYVETAREQVAALAGVPPNQVVFTSGATEASNTVLKHFKNQRILVSAIEHPSVLEAAPDAVHIPVTRDGVIDMDALEIQLNEGGPPGLVSLMAVNNETGVIQPVKDAAWRVKARYPQAFIHTDAVQAAGKIEIDFPAWYADFMSLSAHKFGGPQGVGALIFAPGMPEEMRLLHGGGQEKRRRAGTENIAGIAGFGKAAELALAELEDFRKLRVWHDRLESEIKDTAPGMKAYGANAPRAANTSNLGLPGMPASTQLMNLDLAGIAVSSGSACSSGTVKPSHVLRAMGLSDDEAASALRISSGWATTEADIDAFIKAWKDMYARVKDRL